MPVGFRPWRLADQRFHPHARLLDQLLLKET
jgi:hypothetical protein